MYEINSKKQIMGKRKQQQNNAVTETETESRELDIVKSEKTTEPAKAICQHIGKAIDFNNIKKTLKAETLKNIVCAICSKEGVPPKKKENWVCLQCGARVCSIEHLKNHFDVPRSDLHTIAFSLNNFNIWCETCNNLILEGEFKKLKICVGYIKQMMDKTNKQVQIVVTPYSEDIPPPLVEWNESNDSESAKTTTTTTVPTRKNYCNRPSVRGLINLGNTCFFNSVLQCLARTPKLVETLRKMESDEEQISITLKSGQVLEGTLEKSSDWLGQCLADTLVALCRPCDVPSENPMRLLQLLRKKCPQFEGYDQHDAHELLRHLLDNVRQNDLKRYRSLMLNILGLSRKVNPQAVSPEMQKKVKTLDNEVVERVTLVPEHVFKGLLVSTLECQECKNTSQCVESFLDLSLPIMADKPQPPSMVRRKGSVSPELVDEKAGTVSKHQLKKEAKQAQKKNRNRKYNHRSSIAQRSTIAAGDANVPAAIDSHSDKGESEADVEDNEEDKPHESGYSSEKIHSESSSLSGGDDSARTSPTTHVKEGLADNSKVSVCEGLGTVISCRSAPSSSLNPQPLYVAFLRFKRKPDATWIKPGECLNPSWIPHSDTTLFPNPGLVMDGGESWRNYTPRNGVLPSSSQLKKDSQLNPIVEESDKTKSCAIVKHESSICDQVSLMSKVVETMLAKVHIRPEDLEKYENKSVTHSKEDIKKECCKGGCGCDDAGGDCNAGHCQTRKPDTLHNVINQLSRFQPFSKENCPNADKKPGSFDSALDSKNTSETRQNLTNVTPESENSLSNTLDNKEVSHSAESTSELKTDQQGHNTQVTQQTTDDTSNGFHINSLYNCKNDIPKEKESAPIIGPVDNRTADAEPKDKNDSEEDKELSYISPMFNDVGPLDNKTTEKPNDNNDSDEDKELSYLSPMFNDVGLVNNKTEEKQKDKNVLEGDKESTYPSPMINEVTNKKVEKKEEGESVKYRRRFNDRDINNKNQDFESDCSIQSCLSQFTALEIMSGANRVGCSTCTQRHNKGNKEGKTVNTIASKQLLIKEVPQVLILHLKRFQVQMYSFKKLSKHVFFPLDLDLAPFCLQEVERDEDGKILYSLYGVVEHSGNLNGGHYVAYIKVEDGENSCKWFCISDAHVHEVAESRVLNSQAYLLFYRQILMDKSS